MSYERGNVISVEVNTLGSAIDAAALAGETVLTVDDAADFPEDGGQVVINSTIYLFDSTDLDADTLTLSTPLLADAEEGEPVWLWDDAVGDVSQETTAQVILEESVPGEDPVEAIVPHALTAMLAEGIRDAPAESVSLELDGDEWRVVDVYGVNPTIDGQAVWNPTTSRTISSVTLPHNTWTQVASWTTLEVNGITNGAGSTVIYPGAYLLMMQAVFPSNSTGRRSVRIMSGLTVLAQIGASADDSGNTFANTFTQARLAEGETVTIELWQNTGASMVISGSTISKFVMHRVSV